MSVLCFKVFELFHPSGTVLNWYFEDLSALPIILGIALVCIQTLSPKWRGFTISTIDMIIITVMFSIYFEFILPWFSSTHTKDALDVACYGVGALFFFRVLNKPDSLNLKILLSSVRSL